MSDTPARFTLRQLPVPAKLVVTAFLFAVGLGYVSAMVQLHMQHSDRDGNPLPTPGNVIERFSGLKEADGHPPKSQIEEIISGNPYRGWGSSNMTPAFFAKSGGVYAKECRERGDEVVKAERHGERLAMIAWINAPPEAREKAYNDNSFVLPEPLAGQPVSADFLSESKAVKINDLICGRCTRCHQESGGQYPPLANYEQLKAHIVAAPDAVIDGKWVRSGKQMGVEKLTQSTHAHLLTFAILFGLTGLVFAFTGYSGFLRGTLGPAVLIAQVIDVSCWWLARLAPPYGPTFALTILGTGGVVGLGLVLQITLSLVSMYGGKGRLFILLLMALIGGGLGVVGLKVIQPALDAERDEIAEVLKPKTYPAPDKKPNAPKNPDEPKRPDPAPPKRANSNGVSHLEQLIMGSRDLKVAPFTGKGSMARAFFEQESEFKKAIKGGRGISQLEAEREGERLALQAWLRSDPPARKKAYDEDRFQLPTALASRQITKDYAGERGGTVKVKSILTDRCVGCHAEGAEQDKFPLETYEQLMKYVDANPAGAVIPPAKGE